MERIYIYWNLHKKCWSLRHRGIVIGHAKVVHATGATFKVNEKGRKKVIHEKRKNVHAFVVANALNITSLVDFRPTGNGDTMVADWLGSAGSEAYAPIPKRAYYNPYTTAHFVDYETSERLHAATLVDMRENGIVNYC